MEERLNALTENQRREAGTVALLINGVSVQVSVSAGATKENIAKAIADAVTKKPATQVAAAVKDDATDTVELTVNWHGVTGNGADVRLNYYTGEAFPAGVKVTATAFNRGGKAGKGAGIIAGALEFYDFLTTQYALPGEVDSLTKSVAGDASASPWEREFAQQSQNNQKALESVWRKVTDWFNSLGDKNIADPRPWAGMQPTQNYPFLPQQLQGEIRVVVEGDARVKSVRVDQPGVRLSAQAGVTSVEQG